MSSKTAEPAVTGTRKLASEAETRALSEAIAAVLRPGDTILLAGPVGAGKTAFARAAIQAMQRRSGQVPEDVPSPSFTLLQSYRAGPLEVIHADLYRLSGPDELTELGLEQQLETAVVFIEWPEILGADAPARHAKLTFSPAADADARFLTLETSGSGWEALAGVVSRLTAGAAQQ